jgi:hypothetical protein
VFLVAGDQCRVGFGGKVFGKVERTGGHGGDSEARGGACGKPGCRL